MKSGGPPHSFKFPRRHVREFLVVTQGVSLGGLKLFSEMPATGLASIKRIVTEGRNTTRVALRMRVNQLQCPLTEKAAIHRMETRLFQAESNHFFGFIFVPSGIR